MKSLFLLLFSTCVFTISAQNTNFSFFLSGEASITNILISDHPVFPKEDFGSAIKIGGNLRSGVRYKLSENLGLNLGFEFGLTNYGEDHDRELRGGTGQIGSTAQSSSIRSFNLGVPIFLDIKLASKISFLLGAKYQHNFNGKIAAKILTPTGPSEQDLDFSITKNNFSGNLGFRYYPKGAEEIRKNIFVGLSTEYFFIADRIFFAFNDVNRFSVNFNVGYHF